MIDGRAPTDNSSAPIAQEMRGDVHVYVLHLGLDVNIPAYYHGLGR